MSRRLPSSQRPRVHQPSSDNPYQGTTFTLPIPTAYSNQQQNHLQYTKDNYYSKCINSLRGSNFNNATLYDTGVSEDSCTDHSYCDYNYEHVYHQNNCKKKSKNTDCMFSDDSGSTRLPYYEYDEASCKRHSRNNFSERSSNKAKQFYVDNKFNASLRKDIRRVYPNQEFTFERNFQDGPQRYSTDTPATLPTLPLRGPLSRLSDRPQSSLSSGVASAVVDGCGGRCQTFENVCYYLLQVAFAMGILIGISLCIAGAVLRKSAARNLQVLVYIGALLSMVSALLLGIQCSARNNARKRKKAQRNAKRATIPLDTLNSRLVPSQQQQPLIANHNQRLQPIIQPTQTVVQQPSHLAMQQRVVDVEQPGIPWWKRHDAK